MKSFVFVVSLFFGTLFFASCKKETNTSADVRLGISKDTLRFDTVFTTTGSITKSFKILNNNDQKIVLSKIKLMGGPASAFKINVNGTPANELNNAEIAANDSIYVFVTVNVNPTAANLPFIISDSILINYNGISRYVHLEAYGQNAVFIQNSVITGNVTFTNILPYVILGGLQITSTGFLTINAGTKIYCHADAPVVVDGKMISNGTKTQPVIFAGDRLDDPYINFPGAWPGIYFRATSFDNVLRFTNIKNAYQAVSVQQPSVNTNPKLYMQQCIIDNASDAGILGSNTSITVENTLISNCGKNVNVEYGGNYLFTHCTIAAYSNSYVLHKKPAVFLSDANSLNQTASLNAVFRNSIIYGDAGFTDTEIQTNKTGNNAFNVNVDHCLYRAVADPTNVLFMVSTKNMDPLFDSIDNTHRYYDFRNIKNAAAPGIDKGMPTSLIKDLGNNNRNVGLPDLGAYERQ